MHSLKNLMMLILLLPMTSSAAGIVNRTSTRDTLALPFLVLDSLGTPVNLASGDSIYVAVFSPGGTVVFKDSMAYNDVSIVSSTWEDFNGGKQYAYVERVSVLDGASGSDGVFSYVISIDDNTGADLITAYTGQFQIINTTLESSLDSAGLAAINSSQALDSLAIVIDSLYAVLDSLQDGFNGIDVNVAAVSGDVAASDSLEAMLDGTRATLFLSQLNIVADGNKDAIMAAGSGSGGGILASGGSTGTGMTALGGTTSGDGIKARASVGANGNGLVAIGEGTGVDLSATIDLDDLSGSLDAAEIGANAIGASQLAADAAAEIEDSVHAQSGDYKATGFATHTALDVWNSSFGATFGAGSMGDSLNNASYVQGSGGSSDSTSIARWVWNTPQPNHVGANTFGKYLDTEVSGIGSGTGSFSYTIVIYDTSNAQPVVGASVAVRNLSQSALLAVGSSDLSGTSDFNLNADSHTVVTTAPGFVFESFDTVVVIGAGVDTVMGYQFDPGTPPAPGLCRVFGYVLSIDGLPDASSTISAHLPKGVVRSSGSIVSPFTISTTTDTLGYWAVDVIPSSTLSPATTKYEFLITRSDGTILRKRVTVPNQSSWQLTW